MGEPIGWVVVDRDTKKLDWDGELHPSQEAAAKSLSSNALWQDQDWQPFILYDICPVYPAPEPADVFGDAARVSDLPKADQTRVDLEADR